MRPLTRAALAASIDQTLLSPTIGPAAAARWLAENADLGFASLCVAPALVPAAARVLADSSTKVCSVVGFPLGYSLPASKADEAHLLCENGAEEIDMVVNIGALMEADEECVFADIDAVVRAVRSHAEAGVIKVILETGYLDEAQIRLGCRLAVAAGADYVKTSTGFGPRGASVRDVEIMREEVGALVGVKAAGGIRELSAALELLDAGASRIGTSAGGHILAAADADGWE